MPRRESELSIALRKILATGLVGTQDEICAELKRQGFEATQSTVSRTLRKLGAVRAFETDGRIVYRISELSPPQVATAVTDLVLDVRSNGGIIVVRTTPGSASLVARHLDHGLPGEILGTLAGDDTIFVAPMSLENIQKTLQSIRDSFQKPE